MCYASCLKTYATACIVFKVYSSISLTPHLLNYILHAGISACYNNSIAFSVDCIHDVYKLFTRRCIDTTSRVHVKVSFYKTTHLQQDKASTTRQGTYNKTRNRTSL